MMHDVAITTNYSLFYDYNNKYSSPAELMTGKAKQMYVVATIPSAYLNF